VSTYDNRLKLSWIVLFQEFLKLGIIRIVATWILNWVIIQVLCGVVFSAQRWLLGKVPVGKLVQDLIFLLLVSHGLGKGLVFLLLDLT
jgi:hypothetical protein